MSQIKPGVFPLQTWHRAQNKLLSREMFAFSLKTHKDVFLLGICQSCYIYEARRFKGINYTSLVKRAYSENHTQLRGPQYPTMGNNHGWAGRLGGVGYFPVTWGVALWHAVKNQWIAQNPRITHSSLGHRLCPLTVVSTQVHMLKTSLPLCKESNAKQEISETLIR